MTQIVWHGPALTPTGFGKSSREYVLALHAAGADVKLEPYETMPDMELPPGQLSILEHLITKRQETVNRVNVYHSFPELWRGTVEPSFGFIYWHTTKIPDNWINLAHPMSAVLLSSFHNINLFRSAGVDTPLFYVRPCLSRPYHTPSMEHTPPYINHLTPFRFLCVCSGIKRKGIDILLKAFWSEFTADDPVCLFIKTTGPIDEYYHLNAWQQELNLSHPPAPVHIDHEVRSEMEALYASSHVFVLATRGEGVGYPVLEAAMRGTPCIVTGWGGYLDFLNEHNSYLIPYKFVPIFAQPYYQGYTYPNQLWAEPSIDELRKIMRHVTTHYQEALSKGEKAKAHILSHFSPDKAAQDLIGALSQITGLTFV